MVGLPGIAKHRSKGKQVNAEALKRIDLQSILNYSVPSRKGGP